jgi:hypothetical protein
MEDEEIKGLARRRPDTTTATLVGKYFIGVHDECLRSGIIEAAIIGGFYLVRFDELIGFTDGSKWPDPQHDVERLHTGTIAAGRQRDDAVGPLSWLLRIFLRGLNRRLPRDLPDSDPAPLASSGAQAKRLKVNHARGLGLGRKNLFTAFIVDRAWATKFPEPVRNAEHASMRRHGPARFTRRARRGPITKDSTSLDRG